MTRRRARSESLFPSRADGLARICARAQEGGESRCPPSSSVLSQSRRDTRDPHLYLARKKSATDFSSPPWPSELGVA